MTWLVRSSPACPSNSGISEGNLVSMGGQPVLCKIESLRSFSKSDKFIPTIYESWRCYEGLGGDSAIADDDGVELDGLYIDG